MQIQDSTEGLYKCANCEQLVPEVRNCEACSEKVCPDCEGHIYDKDTDSEVMECNICYEGKL